MSPAPTPTPRTSDFAESLQRANVPASRAWPHWFDHSAQLERELAEAKAEIAAKSEQWRMSSVCREMKEQAGRLAGALEALIAKVDWDYGIETIGAGSLNPDNVTWRGWRKDMPEGLEEVSNENGVPPEEQAEIMRPFRKELAAWKEGNA